MCIHYWYENLDNKKFIMKIKIDVENHFQKIVWS